MVTACTAAYLCVGVTNHPQRTPPNAHWHKLLAAQRSSQMSELQGVHTCVHRAGTSCRKRELSMEMRMACVHAGVLAAQGLNV